MKRAELIPSHRSVAQKAERGTAPLIMDPVSSLCSKMFKLHRISELQTQLFKNIPELMSANLKPKLSVKCKFEGMGHLFTLKKY